MEPNTPRQEQVTTVGRVQVPEITLHQQPSSLLAGTLSGSYITPANSARRRLYGPTLLGSPARRGHTPRMADIFGDAKNNLASKSVPSMNRPSASATMRQLPLRPKPVSTNCDVQVHSAMLPPESPGGVPIFYPKLDFDVDSVVSRPGSSPPRSEAAESPRPNGIENAALLPVAPRLSPTPLTRQHSYFNKPPAITHAHAQIVPMSAIPTPSEGCRIEEDIASESSASWTGDSQFYIPREQQAQKRVVSLPRQERKCSVPEWLERLPAEPEDFEQEGSTVEKEGQEIVPLSPDVEIERGSMRKRMRGRKERKRQRSFGEGD